MDSNYLVEKLRIKSEINLQKEIEQRAGNLDVIDGQPMCLSSNALEKIIDLCKQDNKYICPGDIIRIIVTDIIAISTPNRIKLDIDAFLQDIEEIKSKLDSFFTTYFLRTNMDGKIAGGL